MQKTNLPIFLEKDEDNFYVAECPVLEGCYSQGKTIDEAISNIKEAISLALEDKDNKPLISHYQKPREISFHTVAI